jgi:hypothetical protein
MDEISINFSQGNEDELTILNEGMWDLEFLSVDFSIIKEEDIQINGSGPPSKSV